VSAAALRGAAFAALALYVALSPAWHQVLGGDLELPRAWRMFASAGVGLVDARFRVREDDGRERPLDRYEALGIALPRAAPARIRRPRGAVEFWALVRELCERLPGADLRADVRVATRAGWRVVELPPHGLCAAPAAPNGGGR